MHVPDAEIVRRRVTIDFKASQAESWSGRGKEFETYMNALSFVFPPGEAFFVMSVRNYLAKITDPVLKEQAGRFIFQEVMHSKEHARCNRVLNEIHASGQEMSRISASLLSLVRRFSIKSAQLAVTCALEHFTAMLSDGLLKNQQRIVAEFDPAFAALWLWHAVEETEHKAVCFDVYQHVCGKGVISYLHRVFIMALTSVTFIGALSVGFTMMKWKTRRQQNTDPTDQPIVVGPRRFFRMPKIWFLLRAIPLKMYLDYYRFSFHPWDTDNRNLVDAWKTYYADFGLEAKPRPVAATVTAS